MTAMQILFLHPRIETHRNLRRFHQQRPQQSITLLGDRSQLLPPGGWPPSPVSSIARVCLSSVDQIHIGCAPSRAVREGVTTIPRIKGLAYAAGGRIFILSTSHSLILTGPVSFRK
jgi:hypothetical protein